MLKVWIFVSVLCHSIYGQKTMKKKMAFDCLSQSVQPMDYMKQQGRCEKIQPKFLAPGLPY